MNSRNILFSFGFGMIATFSALAFAGCGGGSDTPSTPPVDTPKIAPDAPFGGLSNPYNEDEKKTAKKK